MAHSHTDRDVIVTGDGGNGFGAGVLLAVAALVFLAVIGLALLFTQPWDDDDTSSAPSVPDVTDDSGGGGDVVPDDVVPEAPGDGGTDGGESAPSGQ